MSFLADQHEREDWNNSLRPRWQLVVSLVWWAIIATAFTMNLWRAWNGRMIGTRWVWIASSIVWILISLYRLGALSRALKRGAYRGEPLV